MSEDVSAPQDRPTVAQRRASALESLEPFTDGDDGPTDVRVTVLGDDRLKSAVEKQRRIGRTLADAFPGTQALEQHAALGRTFAGLADSTVFGQEVDKLRTAAERAFGKLRVTPAIKPLPGLRADLPETLLKPMPRPDLDLLQQLVEVQLRQAAILEKVPEVLEKILSGQVEAANDAAAVATGAARRERITIWFGAIAAVAAIAVLVLTIAG